MGSGCSGTLRQGTMHEVRVGPMLGTHPVNSRVCYGCRWMLRCALCHLICWVLLWGDQLAVRCRACYQLLL